MSSQKTANYQFEAEAQDALAFTPDAVGIHAIGEVESGPRTFLDNYPHTTVSFIQPLKGSLDIRLSDRPAIRLEKMQFSVIFPGRLITLSSKSKNVHFAYLSVTGPRVVEAVLRLGFWEFQSETDDFPTEYFRQVSGIFRQSGCKSDDPAALLAVERMLRTMAVRRRHCGGNIPFFDAIRTINCMGFSNFTTENAAREIGISRSSLRNLFAAANFTSPGNYMDDVRIARAKEYLYRTRKSTAEIASDLGFANENSFAQFFRRRTGITPARFRRQPILMSAP